ncbi:MAG: amino acid permease, partial [Planctomycetota bacterium]
MRATGPSEVGFGTFGGVFTPCTLTILGVIMFLRFGYVVGQGGLIAAILIVVFSKLITVLTSLSLAAIATNTRVEGGGAYFLISRSLGPEFGGAIGLMFFAAQALSVAMYVIGFTEALVAALPIQADPRFVATLTNIAVFSCVLIGAGWTIKLQLLILAAVLVSLGSFFAGAWQTFDATQLEANLTASFSGGESFWTMFALFFPAVTGIMAGANMSGDLKNPAKSIPLGTLSAVAATAVIYLLQAIFLAGAGSRDALVGDAMVVSSLSSIPGLITVGVFAATLSSALGSMMGAPRILQSLARDRLFSQLSPLAGGSGQSNEPRRAV